MRGRLWRRANPGLPEAARAEAVNRLMAARRGVRDALASDDEAALKASRAAVDAAKRELGERGPVWWTDGLPDFNRRMIANTPYAGWWLERQDGGRGRD